MKVLSLKISNFRGIEALELSPDGQSVVVEGPNGSGKSSLLGAVMYALTGDAGGTPVRQGAELAEVEAAIGDYVVRRTCPVGGKERLVVRTKDGGLKASPQKFLNELIGAGLAFDPLKFEAMKPADQRQALLRGVGVDLGSLDQKRADAYATRREIGRRHDEAKGTVATLDTEETRNAPDSVDSASLLAEVRRLREHQAQSERVDRNLADVRGEVEDAERRLAEARKLLVQVEAARSAHADKAGELAAAEQRMADTGKVAALSERKKQLLAEKDRTAKLAAEYDRLSQEIEKVDGEKAALLGNLKLGIDGLDVREDGLYVGGLALASLNRAQRIRIGLRIAARLSPTLRVALIDEASSLDRDSTADIATAARDCNLQLWLARVADEPSVHFEVWDGSPMPQPEVVAT